MFILGILKGRQLERPRHRRERIFKWILGKQGLGAWNGFTWLSIGTGYGFL
jgi:hypothetical protein